ncbi:MAG: glycosyltransferase family 2 protein [Mediterranea sp.]|jgi:glycosyltransferase involved in cell wall biosynthesis|nr:glycosyltransferase family 2 protein [Mediterranea sp.]
MPNLPNISIIFAFRDRDYLRVKRCLDSLAEQTYKDIEVLFIDYGSQRNTKQCISELVKSYSFTKYLYIYTEGMIWNKPHALNIGIQKAISPYILIGDIDLIYSTQAIDALWNNRDKEGVVCPEVLNLLPKNMSMRNLKSTNDIRAFLLVRREVLIQIRGFDEYYCFWGVEDRDLYSRLTYVMRMPCMLLDETKCRIYHQWHPIVSDRKKGFFPDRWWDDMNIYYAININNVIRNTEGWGRLLTEEDRPIFTAIETSYDIPYTIANSYQKASVYESIITSVMQLKQNECLSVRVRIPKHYRLLYKSLHFINSILRKIRFPVGFDEMTSVERERFFYPRYDILYLIWHLIKKEGLIRDYHIQSQKDQITIKLMR